MSICPSSSCLLDSALWKSGLYFKIPFSHFSTDSTLPLPHLLPQLLLWSSITSTWRDLLQPLTMFDISAIFYTKGGLLPPSSCTFFSELLWESTLSWFSFCLSAYSFSVSLGGFSLVGHLTPKCWSPLGLNLSSLLSTLTTPSLDNPRHSQEDSNNLCRYPLNTYPALNTEPNK